MSDLALRSTRNPRTGEADYHMPVFDAPAVTAKASALRTQQPAWAALSAQNRADAVRQWIQQLRADRMTLLHALAHDTGRWREGLIEVDATLGAMARWCDQAGALLAAGDKTSSGFAHISLQQHRVPYPLVGIISPWNFPFLLSLIDAVPALLAGCSVLLKPSEITPRFVPVLQNALHATPVLASVFCIVTGAAETGRAVVDNVDLICFTGSVATGRKVAVQAAQRFIGANLELGGKDAAIVFADVDLDRAARSLCWGSMVNAGQSCMSLERAYVERAAMAVFMSRLTHHVSQLQPCWPDIQQGDTGPIIALAQVAGIRDHLQDAFDKGATALTGGHLVQHGGGWWCEPTVLVNVNHSMRIMREETFAPILPIMAFDTEQQSINLANDNDYGLSASVFSADLARAQRVASQLRAGAVSINDASLTAIVHGGAKQSFGLSGLGGSRMGPRSIDRFVRLQSHIHSNGADSPWWYR